VTELSYDPTDRATRSSSRGRVRSSASSYTLADSTLTGQRARSRSPRRTSATSLPIRASSLPTCSSRRGSSVFSSGS